MLVALCKIGVYSQIRIYYMLVSVLIGDKEDAGVPGLVSNMSRS